MTFIIDAQFFHFLVLLKNYDRRRLKHKVEFIFKIVLQPFSTRRSNIIFFLLQSSLSCHFSIQFLHLVISITDKCTVTIESQYLKVFVMLQLPLISSLCRIVFRLHDYITREHTLTFEITFT